MKRLLSPAVLGAATALLLWIPSSALAQGGGGGGGAGGGGGGGRPNFDPAEMRQRMMDRYKELLDVKSDDEWKIIEPRIQKVTDARRDVGFGGMGRGMFGRGGRGPGGGGTGGGGQGGPGGDNAGDQPQRRAGGGGGGFFGQQSAAAQDLQKAIDSKASTDQIKAKLTAYREDKKDKQAKLEKAQEDLKQVLSVKQEAAAVLAGLLD